MAHFYAAARHDRADALDLARSGNAVMASTAERKQTERERKRKAGLIPKEIWTRPEHWPSVKRYVERLNKRAALLNGVGHE